MTFSTKVFPVAKCNITLGLFYKTIIYAVNDHNAVIMTKTTFILL